MNGAESLIRTAAAAGVTVCFANPGTTEMPLVAALDAVEEMRAVLGLFEGVCTGAADGYARMADKPAMTLLHLGPGFANGIANLHNARRAHSPVVNVIGDHATWHQAADAPLASDIVSLAKPVSGWIRAARSAKSLARDMADAIAAAGRMPGQVATLIVPSDCQWENADRAAPPIAPSAVPAPPGDAIDASAEAIRRDGAKTAMLLGGLALRERGLRAAAKIAASSGCALICETFPARIERGVGLPAVARLPYFPEQAVEMLAKFQTIVLAGAREPVAFFGYPNLPSRLLPKGCSVVTLATPEQDAVAGLEALVDACGASRSSGVAPPLNRPALPRGPLNAFTIAQTIAALMPEGAIVMDEAATTGFAFFDVAAAASRHTCLTLTGGAIGQGLPCTTGAAIACPDRRVIAFQADGSAMYTIQALWTQAREGLNATTLLCNNRSYRILQVELQRAGVVEPGRKARSLTELSSPDLDFVRLSRSMGVPAVRVETAEALADKLRRALSEPGPQLIEMML
jgi:acetolactate synthase I/II/III large subunit